MVHDLLVMPNRQRLLYIFLHETSPCCKEELCRQKLLEIINDVNEELVKNKATNSATTRHVKFTRSGIFI
jgi:hypothetical protein